MSRAKLQTLVATEYAKLDNWADRSTVARSLLDKAFEAAVDGEKRHRRGVPSGYKGASVETAAKWFVLKWALTGHASGRSEAASRHDLDGAFYGYALGEMFLDETAPKFDRDAILAVSYETDIAS